MVEADDPINLLPFSTEGRTVRWSLHQPFSMEGNMEKKTEAYWELFAK